MSGRVCWACGNPAPPDLVWGPEWAYELKDKLVHPLWEECDECRARVCEEDDSMTVEEWVTHQESPDAPHHRCHHWGSDCPPLAQGHGVCMSCKHALPLRALALAEEHLSLRTYKRRDGTEVEDFEVIGSPRPRGTYAGPRTWREADRRDQITVPEGTQHVVIEADRQGEPYRLCRACIELIREHNSIRPDPDYAPAAGRSAQEQADDLMTGASEERLAKVPAGEWMDGAALGSAWSVTPRRAKQIADEHVRAGRMETETRPTPGGGKPTRVYRLATSEPADDGADE
ncbi:MAG TPA: hypothetical protein VHR55_07995 [Candidatus Limnocylindria bacterium]|nr:hypothetical protein [Candidatus Limnocylindria bacterium]